MSTLNLVCKACGYANESERVYCHNCGVKLDRAVLIPQMQKQAQMAQRQHREVKKIMSPSRGSSGRFLKSLFRTVLLAAIFGVLINAMLPPEWVQLPAKGGEIAEALPLDTILENLVAAPNGKRLAVKEADVNVYLRKEHFKKLPPGLTLSIPVSALVHFEENIATLAIVGNVGGYPVCLTLSGNLKVDKAVGLVGTCTGASIGRLPIPAELARYGAGAILSLLDSLKHERELLIQLGFIEVGKEQITFGAHAPSAPAGPVNPVSPNGGFGRPGIR